MCPRFGFAVVPAARDAIASVEAGEGEIAEREISAPSPLLFIIIVSVLRFTVFRGGRATGRAGLGSYG